MCAYSYFNVRRRIANYKNQKYDETIVLYYRVLLFSLGFSRVLIKRQIYDPYEKK